mgnify:CR=1 FL=1
MAAGIYVPDETNPRTHLKRIGLFLGLNDALKSDLLKVRKALVLTGSFSQLADIVEKPWSGSAKNGSLPFLFAIFVRHDCARAACRTQCARSGLWERWFNPLINPAPLRRHLCEHPKLRRLAHDQKRLLIGPPELVRQPRIRDEMLRQFFQERTLTPLNGFSLCS